MNIDISTVVEIARKAGAAIMDVYNSGDFSIKDKSDGSPLTEADRVSHQIITSELIDAYPDIPILSEEGMQIDFETRTSWSSYWLVDPLDGTKEFINRNGEFTVNIALMENNRPVMGVIYAPVLNLMYYGKHDSGAFKIWKNQSPERIVVDRLNADGLVAVKSRSHSSAQEAACFECWNVTNTIAVGSSLKFCMVAEGKAHIYYRHGPTWEWDTAAGHAIAESAGAVVKNLIYNKETLKNGPFLVSAVDIVTLDLVLK